MPKGYSRSQIVLHWLTVVLVAWQFIGNDAISAAWRSLRQGGSPAFDPLVAGHVAGGIAVLVLALWRIGLQGRRGAPAPAEGGPAILRPLSKLAHAGLYLAMIALAVTGGMAWFGGISVAAEAHEVLKAVLLALIGLHVAGALWHQFVLRDGLMRRMARPAD
ncbi:cytochrome b [Gemmobacter sp. LW-1]|jgi:cytochrome b561|uniref:cytochrome b n=1 Tax=Gemmobacter sp. LW-1 TaxID=1529005 RepID=UPI0006C7399D|nr:cytochrome b/b6 domain-containing protein [Gemmobacter sp. LW-1]